MPPRPLQYGSPRPRRLSHAGRALALVLLLLAAAPAPGRQNEQGGPPIVEPEAAFVWQLPDAGPSGGKTPGDWEWAPLGGGDARVGDHPDAGADAGYPTEGWLLESWSPSIGHGEAIVAEFSQRRPALGPAAGPEDHWARSVFAQDASQLTPLTLGQEVVGFELADGLTLSGVGSRRVITEQNRGFVLSAEAGIRLSPHAGFQIGYELLQSSAGAAGEGLGGESVFARFQLRF